MIDFKYSDAKVQIQVDIAIFEGQHMARKAHKELNEFHRQCLIDLGLWKPKRKRIDLTRFMVSFKEATRALEAFGKAFHVPKELL
jgi:hypothetical protein